MKFKNIGVEFDWSKAKVLPVGNGEWSVMVPLRTEDGHQGDAQFEFCGGRGQAQRFLDDKFQATVIPEPKENA